MKKIDLTKMNLTSDTLLKQLGLEKSKGNMAKAMPVLAGIGLGTLAGMGLVVAWKNEKVNKKVTAAVKDVKGRLTKARAGKKPATTGPQATKGDGVHAASSKRDEVHARA